MSNHVIAAYAAAIGEAIEALGEIPSGHLYVRVMSYMDLDTYQSVLDLLVRQKKIKVRSDLLIAIGGGE